MAEKMVIFTRTFDFTRWILEVTRHFPKSQRFVLTQRLQNSVFDFYEQIVLANQNSQQRSHYLKLADGRLMLARFYFRLCHKMGWLSEGQYYHGAEFLSEIGRLLGGWIKQSFSSSIKN